MFFNYLKIAFRNLKRNKLYSLINIFGLAIGLACCIMILLWIVDEFSYDKQHDKSELIGRIISDMKSDKGGFKVAVSPAWYKEALADVPEIEQIARFKYVGNWNMRIDDQKPFSKVQTALADPEMLKIFTHNFLKGSSKNAIQDLETIVISQSAANQLFGKDDPIGKSVEIKDGKVMQVVGVFDDLSHSHIHYDAVINFSYFELLGQDIQEFGKGVYNYTTYVKLQDNANINIVDTKLRNHLDKLPRQDLARLYLQPLEDIYLNSNYAYDFTIQGDINSIYLFSVVAFLVLLIASINFMNLSTAKAAKRAKEIGLRKVLGANRKQIQRQFFGESMLMSILALLVALVLVELLLPSLNSLVGKDFSSSNLLTPFFVIVLLGITLFTGFASGIYPAIFLSSFQPAHSLKGNNTRNNFKLRKFLVIFQFSLSVFFMIGSLVVSQQLRFIQNKNLGYNQHNLSYLTTNPKIRNSYEAIKGELEKLPNIKSVSASNVLPIYECPSLDISKWDGNSTEKNIRLHLISASQNYVNTMQIKMFAGKHFTKNSAQTDLLVNKKAIETMGMEEPLGKKISIGSTEYTISGIVEDFNFNLVKAPIAPLAITLNTDANQYLLFRTSTSDKENSYEKVKSIITKFDPDFNSGFRELATTLRLMYRSEQKTEKLLQYFTLLAILISCLGLLGLISYIIEQKRKEIGIRKTLGATTSKIVTEISSNFVKWILVSNLFAWPLAWWMASKWLQNFAYKTPIHLWFFPVIGFLSLLLALVTIISQTIFAAKLNPANVLKNE
jgi:ABC-type antimicrobial peptide transport system permease subunit